MIKPQEIRIGNYVKDRGGKTLRIDYWESANKIAQLVFLGVDFAHPIMTNAVHPLTEEVDYLEPIPLTEQWLKDFYFTKNRSNIWESEYYGVTIHEHDGRYLIEFGNGGQLYIKHVHQLQNLYFALTGEELKLNNGSY